MKILPVMIAAIALAGCDARDGFPTTEYSPTLHENGKVINLTFLPSGNGHASTVGISMSGNLVVGGGSVHVPARYGIVFECEHGSFAIEGKEAEAVWNKLRVGDAVDIQYREEYRYYKKSGKREFVDLQFITATPIR